MEASTRKARTWLAAALWAVTLDGAAAAPILQGPTLTLDAFREAQKLDWDLRDEQNRAIVDPALREAMVRDELDSAYSAEFRPDDPTTASLLAWLSTTLGRRHWGSPTVRSRRGAWAAVARRPEHRCEPAAGFASLEAPRRTEALDARPPAIVFRSSLVLRC